MSPVRPLAMEWHSLCRWWKQWRLRCLAVFVLHRLADELKGWGERLSCFSRNE